uniref:STPPase_N domain-containing protein n=1 Tax=Ascaris lumbricoides TaxID=6252 RepID=A0A0M3IWL3_ASCLU
MVSRRKPIQYNEFDVNDVIRRLIAVKTYQKSIDVSEHELKMICNLSRSIFMSQPMLLELEAPLKIAGNFFNILLLVVCREAPA